MENYTKWKKLYKMKIITHYKKIRNNEKITQT